MRASLPAETQGPFFNDEFGDTFGNIYAFAGDGFSYEELRQYLEDAKREVLRVPDVAKVSLLGVQEQRVYVDLSSAKLASLGLDTSAIWKALQQQNAMMPSGVFETASDRIWVRPPAITAAWTRSPPRR